MRAFAAAHPDDVTGLVLVDVATASVLQRWPKTIAKMRSNLQRGRWLAAVGLLRLANPLHLDVRAAALTHPPCTTVGRRRAAPRRRRGHLAVAAADHGGAADGGADHGRGGDWAGPAVIGRLDEAAIEYDCQAAQKELAQRREVVAGRGRQERPASPTAEQPSL